MEIFVVFLFVLGLVAVGVLFFAIRYLVRTIRAYGVPFVPTPDDLITLFLDDLEMQSWQVFVDLWCGDAKVLSFLSQKFPLVDAVGYEVDGKVFKLARIRQQKDKHRYRLYQKNFFKTDLSDADVVYFYALPHLVKKVWKKICQDCQPWTLFYCNAFAVPNVEILRKLSLSTKGRFRKEIFVYRVK